MAEDTVSGDSKEVTETERNLFVGTYSRAPVVIKSGKGYRVFCTNSRIEANEAAIKFVRKLQRLTNCFHGRTMGSLALTSKEHYSLPFEPLLPGLHL
ncbi:Acetylornithine aminotransferase [Canna indica]|uniref:Acetylornithine aminotransferase n=1 Tax=Canna indica TaxID=4628 RepID=A0AAQ3QP47_9LILI|nr:Acetylornithine aminotransferase [Canna indica]